VLTNRHGPLLASEPYTLAFDGNAQALDHILVSDALAGG
jgi:predicted extracellular nuclease